MKAVLVFSFSGESIPEKRMENLFYSAKKGSKFKNKKGDYLIAKDESRWIIFYSLGKRKKVDIFILREAILKVREIVRTLRIRKIKVFEKNLRKLPFL